MRLLERLGDHVAWRHPPELAAPAGEGLLDEHAGDRVHRVLPHGPFLGAIHEEAPELGAGAGLAGAEVDAAVGDQVERRDALSHTGGVVDARWDLDDAVAEPDALGAHRRGCQEDLRRRAVAVLLEEVVLDLPDVVDADPVGEHDLLERVLQQLVVGALAGPGPRVLMFVEGPEAHPKSLPLSP